MAFLRVFGSLGELISLFVERTLEAGAGADSLVVVWLLFGITVWLGSACWASSIAETRLHSPKLHFLIGLFLPVAYPPILLFTMEVKLEKSAPKAEDEFETPPAEAGAGVFGDEAVPVGGDDVPPPDAAEAEGFADGDIEPEPEVQVYDQEYFRLNSRDEAGEFVGPWQIRFGDTMVVAQRILEALPHVIVVEAVPRPGSPPQRMRIPYPKIESCVRM